MNIRRSLTAAICLMLYFFGFCADALSALPANASDGLQVTTSPTDGCFPIAGQTTSDKAIILYDANDAEVVQTVIDCLISDLKAVTRKTFIKYKTEPSSL